MADIIYRNEYFKIKGAAIEVHKRLGSGFLEKVYQDELEIEFQLMGIPYEREKQIKVKYRGIELEHDFFADFLCYGKIVVELKAVSAIEDIHKAQVLNYLHATEMDLGILINFGEPSLVTHRLINFKHLNDNTPMNL